MRLPVHPFAALWLAASLTLPGLLLSAGAAPNVAPAGSNTNTVAQLEVPKSVFVIPSNTKEGRNPFFPGAAQPVPPPPGPGPTRTIDTTLFVLNGITSPPKRTAMINGRTFEPGETGEVKLPNGSRTLIKCEEIRDTSAIIIVDSQRRELRLRSGI